MIYKVLEGRNSKEIKGLQHTQVESSKPSLRDLGTTRNNGVFIKPTWENHNQHITVHIKGSNQF